MKIITRSEFEQDIKYMKLLGDVTGITRDYYYVDNGDVYEFENKKDAVKYANKISKDSIEAIKTPIGKLTPQYQLS